MKKASSPFVASVAFCSNCLLFKAPVNRTHSRRFARSEAGLNKSRQRLDCVRFSAALLSARGESSIKPVSDSSSIHPQ